MLVQEMVQLGAKRSGIRELFEFGLQGDPTSLS